MIFRISFLWRVAWICGVFWGAVFWSAEGIAGDLRVHITGLRNTEGTVHLGLYNHPDAFPKPKATVRDQVVPAALSASQAVIFGDLPPGEYALAMYHDENSNGAFDQGLLGWPLEGFGFSQGARPFLGPPSFSSAAFSLGPQGGEIMVEFTYWQADKDRQPHGFTTGPWRP